MDLKIVKITLGRQQGPCNILPDDTIQGTRTGIQYHVRGVGYDKIADIYWLWTETEKSQEPTDTEYILVKESKFAPWYHEVCETCVTPESCDLCQKLAGWTTKKFAYIGDTIEFFDSQEVIEEISMDPIIIDKLTVTTDKSTGLFLDDPEIKIIKRGPWLCYRTKINPDYLAHCSVCLCPKCSECFFLKLQENQG
jgi:hypothetical protein